MGMYTELHFNAKLRADVPAKVVSALQQMLGVRDPKRPPIDHEFFDAQRWSYMLTCDSYYFAADTHSTLRFDDISKSWMLCVRCNLKNYDAEIEKFLDWIMPFVDAQPGDFLGFHRYEASEDPELIRYPAAQPGAEGDENG